MILFTPNALSVSILTIEPKRITWTGVSMTGDGRKAAMSLSAALVAISVALRRDERFCSPFMIRHAGQVCAGRNVGFYARLRRIVHPCKLLVLYLEDTYITEFYRALFMKKTTVVTIEGRSLRERQVREGTHAHKSSDFVRTIRSHTDAPITVIKHANKHKQVKALKY